MGKRSIKLLSLAGAIALTVPVWAAGGGKMGHGSTHATKPAAGASAALGLYAKDCAGCHGAKMQGGAGPNLQHEGKTRTATWLVKKITDPKSLNPKTIMPPASQWHLSPDQIKSLANYLAAQK